MREAPLSPVPLYFSSLSLLCTALHYLNAWNRLLPPGGSLGIPKILSTGATSHLVPIRLLVENWECRALKSSARCQKFGVHAVPIFLARACKWRFRSSKILGEAGKQENVTTNVSKIPDLNSSSEQIFSEN